MDPWTVSSNHAIARSLSTDLGIVVPRDKGTSCHPEVHCAATVNGVQHLQPAFFLSLYLRVDHAVVRHQGVAGFQRRVPGPRGDGRPHDRRCRPHAQVVQRAKRGSLAGQAAQRRLRQHMGSNSVAFCRCERRLLRLARRQLLLSDPRKFRTGPVQVLVLPVPPPALRWQAAPPTGAEHRASFLRCERGAPRAHVTRLAAPSMSPADAQQLSSASRAISTQQVIKW